jgi:hypothetical protein
MDPAFFNQLAEFIPAMDNSMRQQETEPLAKTVRAISRMVCDSLGGLSILALNGHDIDALRIARCMFEGAVTAAYLAKFQEELDDYLQFVRVSAKRLLDYSDENPNGREPVDPLRRAQIESNFDSVKSRYTNSKGVLRQTWCRKPVSQMFADVGLAQWYPSFYHLASSAVHMNARGMFMHYHLSEAGDPVFAPPPRTDWIQQSLASARVAIWTSLRAYAEVTHESATRLLIDHAIELFSLK